MYSPSVAGTIITACAVLHNIMVDAKYPLPTEEEIEEQMEESNDNSDDEFQNHHMSELRIRRAGFVARNNLIRENF